MIEKAELIEWIRHFKEHVNLLKGDLKKSEEGKDADITFTYKNKVEKAFAEVEPSSIASLIKNEEPTIIVVANTKKNLKKVNEEWEEIAKHPNLTLFFVNPKSETEKRWIIKPYVHNRISEDPKTGLEAMFATVEEVR